jgi:hypothetical protein
VVSVKDPYKHIFGFLDWSQYFSSKQLLNFIHMAEWTLFQTHYFSGNLVNTDHCTTEVVLQIYIKEGILHSSHTV